METYQEWKKRRSEEGTLGKKTTSTPSSGNSKKKTSTGVETYTAWKERRSAEGTLPDVRAKRFVNTAQSKQEELFDYMDRAGAFYNSAKNDYDSTNWGNASNVFKTKRNEALRLRDEGLKLQSWLTENKDYIDPETYGAVYSQLSDINGGYMDIVSNFRKNADFYNQFDTESDYLKWNSYSTTEKRQATYQQNQNRLKELQEERNKLLQDDTAVSSSGAMPYDGPNQFRLSPGNAEKPAANPYTRSGAGTAGMPYAPVLQYNEKYSGKTDEEKTRLEEIDREIAGLEADIAMYERGNTDEDGIYYGSKVVDDYSGFLTDPNFGKFSAADYRNPTREDLEYYDAMQDTASWYVDGYGITRDRNGNEITENVRADDPRYKITDPLGMYLQTTPEERETMLSTGEGAPGRLELLVRDGYYGNWEQLTQDEIGIYYTILGTQGEEAALQYLSDMQTELNRRGINSDNILYKEQFDAANGWGRLGMSALSIPGNLLGGAAGFVDDFSRTVKGEDINPYSAAHGLGNWSQQVRQNQAAAFDESSSWEIPWINFSAGDLYQAAMSAADSRLGAMIGPGAYQALMSMGAASSEARELYEKGASRDQIIAGSLVAGAAEWVTEKYSIESLIELDDADTVLKVLKNIFKQGFTEASEEGLSEIINLFGNAIIMGSESDWQAALDRNDGNTWKALMDLSSQVGSSAFSGFVSGGMGGGASVASYAGNYYNDYQTGRAISQGDGISALQNIALDMAKAESGKTQRNLEKQADRLGKDYKLDVGNIRKNRGAGMLYKSVQSNVNKQNVADIASALQEQGYSEKESKDIAEAFYAQATNQRLVTEEQNKLMGKYANDETVQKVIGDALYGFDSSVSQRNRSLRKFEFDVIRNSMQLQEEQAAKEAGETEDISEEIDGLETSYTVSDDGKAHLVSNPERSVDIVNFASIKNGKVMLRTSDGQEVEASDVQYASEADAIIFETIASMNVSEKSANILLKGFRGKEGIEAEAYAKAIQEAFEYGRLGIPESELNLSSALDASQRDYVYRQGRKAAGKQVAKEQSIIRKEKKTSNGEKRTGTVHFDRKGRTFDAVREASLKTLDKLAAGLGIDIYVYESYENESGDRVYLDDQGNEVEAPNGFYDPSDGSIHIDLNAGQDGKGIILFTASHELVHFIRQWSPAKFKVLANFLVEQYHKKGASVSDLIQQQKDKAKQNGRQITTEEAFEEMVADSMETMLTDGNVVQMMAELKQRDKTLWQKICDWFRDLVADLQQMVDAYRGVKPETAEGRMVADMKESITIFQSLYTDALYDASESFQTAKNTTGDGGVKYSQKYLSSKQNIELISLVERVSNGNFAANEKVYFGTVSKNIADQIYKLTGIRVDGYRMAIEARQIDHILKDHGEHGDTDRSMADPKDISRMEYTLNEPDSIVKSGKTQAYTYMRNGRNRTADTVLYEKNIGEKSYYVVQAVPDTKAKTLYVVTAFIGNSGYKKEASQLINAKDLDATAKTGSANAFNISIREDGNKVNKKLSARTNEKLDRDYMDAVNRGDMRTAQKMVDDAAKKWGAFLNNADANEVFKQNGEVRTFYHGTNTGDFTVFDKSLLGNSSGDMGWFGKGFYFAFSSREAATYGGRVINAYLKMRKPYDYSQLYKFQGSDYVSDKYSRFAWLYNIAKQFPDIVSGQKVYAYPNNSEDGTIVSWKQLAGWMDRIPQEAKFSVEQVDTPYGDIAWELRANPKQESFTNTEGETFTWTEYGMRVLFSNERDAREPINQIGAYLSEVMGVETIPRRSIERIDFSGAVQKAGYDGILQSPSGDEAVVFDASQIKSSDPVTYDDNGNVIPLSQRFDIKNPDIRYSARNKAARDVNAAIQKENAKLKEDVQQLRELLKLQRTVTGGTKFTKSSVESMAGILMKNNNAKGDRKELSRMLNDLYEFIATSKELTWEAVAEQAQPAVDWIRQNVVVKKELSGYAKDILHTLRTSRISLSETQQGEAAYRYGSVNDYRKSMFGNVVIVNDGVPLDIQWQEWASIYPDIFDAEITAADMPGALADVIASLRNSDLSMTEYAYHADIIEQDLLRQVYDGFWRVSTLRTVADVKQREINELKSKHYQKMNDLRQKHQEASEKMKEAQRERIKKLRQEYRDSADKRIQEIKDRHKAKTAQVTESRAKRDTTAKLMHLVLDTVRWIDRPKKGEIKVPDVLKKPYADFLNSIDLSSKRLAAGGDPTQSDLRLANTMSSLATTIERITAGQDPTKGENTALDSGYLDLPSDFVQRLRDMTESITAMMDSGDHAVNAMSAQEVKELSKMIRTLNHAIREVSTLYANMRFANAQELGRESMGFMDSLGEIDSTRDSTDFIVWDNALPFYAFKRFGTGGESVFEGLMDAQDKLAFLSQEIFAFQEKTWNGKDAKAWSEDTHTIQLPSGESLTLTTADAMSIYCLSRRGQGLQHLLGGGVRVIGIQKGSKKAKDSRANLTMEDIDAIVDSLDSRQKKVAEDMQEFMSTTCAKWGNEISMKRFLTREFTEEHYFPIESNTENMTTQDPTAQQSDLFRLLNISATKALTPNANNEVIIRNVFDVFTGHASDMARLNAFGMPLLDYMKWLNYREKTTNDQGQINVKGVRKSMEKAYGTAAKQYVMNLIKDVNGRFSDGGDPSPLMKWMRSAKTASVGNSLRVATLQMTSYPRAALVLSNKNLALGLSKKPNIEKAKKYCGIALWKSFGFYDTNISRTIEDQMKGITDPKQKLIEWSLKGAEIGDALTWGYLWNACEYEVASTKKYKVGSEEFNEAVGKKLREVVYRTQVVDSMLTRSQLMRSKRGMAQEAAAFMSEPTLSANILMDAGFEFNMEKRRSGSTKAAWEKTGKYIGKAVAVYSIGQLTAALLESLWDAWRDDDDEEFIEKYLAAFKENLILDILPFNKIPIVSDVFDAVLSMAGIGFYSSDRMTTTWITNAVSAVDAWKDYLGGESNVTAYGAIFKSVKALSAYYGVAGSGLMREAVALWNNTAGAYDSTLKIRQRTLSKSQLGGEYLDAVIAGNDRQAENIAGQFATDEEREKAIRAAIKNRFTSGEIGELDTAKYLILYGGLDASDAHWNIEKWVFDMSNESGEDYHKYDEFLDAVKSGENLDAVIDEYLQNGVSRTDLRKQISSGIRPEYIDSTAEEREKMRENLLAAMQACGMSESDADNTIGEWEFEAEYGFDYSDRKTAYLRGEVDEATLIKALVEYGGYNPEDAKLQVIAYDWESDGYENVTTSAVRNYQEYCEPADVPKDVYLYIRKYANSTDNDVVNGKKVPYSAVQKIMQEIQAQRGLTSRQKTAIARSIGWKDSTIQKYKLW